MSYEDDMYDHNDDVSDNSTLVKKLRSKIDELAARTKELENENNALKGSQRKQSISAALTARGYPAKIAAFIPSDLEPSDEALDEWLAEYGDVFGGVQPSPAQEQAPQQNAVVVGSAADAEAYRRMNAVEAGAAAPAVVSGDILSQIEGAATMDELMAALRGA